MQIAAVIVAFDPARDPAGFVAQIRGLVARIVIVDNWPDGHPRLPVDMLAGAGVEVIANRNVGGLAGAYNTAIAHLEKTRPATTHVLYLDDDTDAASLAAFLSSPTTQVCAEDTGVAAVAPAYVDRATGMRGAHMQLCRFRLRVLPRELARATEVAFLINSMSLWRLDAVRRIGSYSTCFGIDHVDTDFCLRAAVHGYKLVLNPEVGFLHSIGERRKFRLLGFTLQAGGHGASRRRLIARNTVILAKHYAFRWPAFAVLCVLRLGYEMTGIVLAEPQRMAKLKGMLLGIWSGLLTPYDC